MLSLRRTAITPGIRTRNVCCYGLARVIVHGSGRSYSTLMSRLNAAARGKPAAETYTATVEYTLLMQIKRFGTK
jgi:hypothetical protein